jgi:hypothetical protein
MSACRFLIHMLAVPQVPFKHHYARGGLDGRLRLDNGLPPAVRRQPVVNLLR